MLGRREGTGPRPASPPPSPARDPGGGREAAAIRPPLPTARPRSPASAAPGPVLPARPLLTRMASAPAPMPAGGWDAFPQPALSAPASTGPGGPLKAGGPARGCCPPCRPAPRPAGGAGPAPCPSRGSRRRGSARRRGRESPSPRLSGSWRARERPSLHHRHPGQLRRGKRGQPACVRVWARSEQDRVCENGSAKPASSQVRLAGPLAW